MKWKMHLPKKEGAGVRREEREGGKMGARVRVVGWAGQPGKSKKSLCHLLGKQNWKGAVGRQTEGGWPWLTPFGFSCYNLFIALKNDLLLSWYFILGWPDIKTLRPGKESPPSGDCKCVPPVPDILVRDTGREVSAEFLRLVFSSW
jgi:hypothetical protein